MTEHPDRSLGQQRPSGRSTPSTKQDEWAAPMARVAAGARGIAYTAAGAVATAATTASPGASNAAVAVLADDFGQFLLIVGSVALFAYSGWCVIRAFAAPDLQTDHLQRVMGRLGSFSSGLIHASVGIFAALLSQGVGANPASEWFVSTWASTMGGLLGSWLTGAVGAVLMCYGIYCIYQTRDHHEMSAPSR